MRRALNKRKAGGWVVVLLVAWLTVYLGWLRRPAADLSLTASTSSMPPAAESGEDVDSHQWMLSELRTLQEQTELYDPVFGTTQLRRVERQLEMTGQRAPVEVRISALAAAGDMELLHGRAQQAAAHLATAWDLLVQAGDHWPAATRIRALEDVAIAHLRLAEVKNCIHCNSCESCILPIRGTGVHNDQQPALAAIEYLTQLLKLRPDHLTARWLLNIAYMTVGKYPAEVPPQWLVPEAAMYRGADFPRFENRSEEAGLNTVTLSGGVVADDLNGDGQIDVLISDWSSTGQLRYFENQGNGKFVERTGEANLNGVLGGLNLIQADYDNDGDLDVLVLRGAWRGEAGRVLNSLLQNDGRGRFTDVTRDAGLAEPRYPTQTADWADYDLDGDLDLFIGNEDFPCQLFNNDGHGHFTDVASQAGVTNGRYTKGVVWGDFNNDRYPDIYVSNYGAPGALKTGGTSLFDAHDGQPNRLYRNNRDGTFTDVAEELGVTEPRLGFPTWFWDFNNDGHLDIYAGSYSGRTEGVAAQFLGLDHAAQLNCLYLNDGQGGFRNVALQYGLDRVSLAMGANFGDLDNDGFDDFYLGTGAPEFQSLVPNIMYHNLGGQCFEDVTVAGGFGHLQKGHAIAFADFDNDGDQDVYCVLGGAFPGDNFANALFVNPGFGNHWLKVAVEGRQSNRCGIGTRIHVVISEGGQQRSIYKWVGSGGSFGANPLRQEIGLGQADKIELLEIYWPASNLTQRFKDLPLDSSVRVIEGQENPILRQ